MAGSRITSNVTEIPSLGSAFLCSGFILRHTLPLWQIWSLAVLGLHLDIGNPKSPSKSQAETHWCHMPIPQVGQAWVSGPLLELGGGLNQTGDSGKLRGVTTIRGMEAGQGTQRSLTTLLDFPSPRPWSTGHHLFPGHTVHLFVLPLASASACSPRTAFPYLPGKLLFTH